MVDLAKKLNNDPDMIRLAQIFPDSLQVPYCQTAPKNTELNGLFHCQFAGSDFTKFSGDQTGNLPLGLTAVNPPGSCPAKTDGPVPDGVQLNTLVDSPGVASSAAPPAAAVQTPPDVADTAPPVRIVGGQGQGQAIAPPANNQNQGAVTPPPQAAPQADPNAKPFTLANGQDAKALNAQFASLTPESSCQDGQQACVNGQFAQCANGKFLLTACAGGAQCFALPLVNSKGTSITCATAADAQARIAATGA
ncbi:hypothetical protein ONZ45_g19337 [Pleurotus djamor]|nr:hypothetical protein ONZ45_g19337 [Pleurotus djamor]